MHRPAAAVFAAILLLAAAWPAFADGETPPAVCVRYSLAPDKVRVVLDLPGEVSYSDVSTPKLLQFALSVPLQQAPPPIAVNDPVVTKIEQLPDAQGNAVVRITLAKARKYTAFTLRPEGKKPFRLVVDIIKRFHTVEKRAVSPAINYTRLEYQTDGDYRAAHVLEINAAAPGVRLAVASAPAGDRERVSAMVQRLGAVCGINGGYFLDGTRPVGLLKVDGCLISLPIWQRSALAFPASGPPVIVNPRGAWRLTLPDGSTRDLPDSLDATAITPAPTAVVINGYNFNRVQPVPNGATALIRDGKVALHVSEPTPLAPGELAIQLTGDDVARLDPALADGTAVNLAPVLSPDLADYPCAVGAGPRLLRDGKVETTAQLERFRPDVQLGRNARTGLGITRDKRVIVVVVEAPCAYGGGVTLEELAAMLKERGAVEGINLDGGGSSALAIGADTLNYPAGAWVRPLASGILVFDGQTAAPVAAAAP